MEHGSGSELTSLFLLTPNAPGLRVVIPLCCVTAVRHRNGGGDLAWFTGLGPGGGKPEFKSDLTHSYPGLHNPVEQGTWGALNFFLSPQRRAM